jgi:hypothetical protein
MKKAEIRQRVKRHVKTRGSQANFDITETLCLYWWAKLNAAIFDDKLTRPVRFEIRKYRGMCGWCRPYGNNKKIRTTVIGINGALQDRNTFLNILVHEMIHQHFWEIDGCWDDSAPHHGKEFFEWAPRIKRTAGLTLAVSYDL